MKTIEVSEKTLNYLQTLANLNSCTIHELLIDKFNLNHYEVVKKEFKKIIENDIISNYTNITVQNVIDDLYNIGYEKLIYDGCCFLEYSENNDVQFNISNSDVEIIVKELLKEMNICTQ